MKAYPSIFGAAYAIIAMCFGWAGASANTFYVSVDGRTDNDGSAQRPWPSVEHAVGTAGGGHVVVVKPGVYRGPIVVGRAYAGTAERPTTIRSAEKWKAVIIGSSEHGISNSDGCDWCVVDGFEVLGARLDGVKLNGNHNVVRNCWIHNNGGMGIGLHDKFDAVIEDNLIEFNGCHVQLHHGVYASGGRLTIRRNIVRHNAAYGMHLYPEVKQSLISGNLLYGHAAHSGLILACPAGGGGNMIVNNTIADNAGAIEIWSGDGETIANNILVAQSEPLLYDRQTRRLNTDFNLCIPASAHRQAHSLTAEPLFVDPARGAYWLRSDSPAIGAGRREYAPASDFWRRPFPPDAPIDLGCFPFVARLSGSAPRDSGHLGYAYRFGLAGGHDMPDLWISP
jgi:parallel beta-helix repeat protein